MSKPRLRVTRELFGILGSLPNRSRVQAEWNRYFEEEGIDAFMDVYPTKPEALPERLSEMFHFDRRGYIVGSSLQKAIISLLDRCDASVMGQGSVNLIRNTGGVLEGFFLEEIDNVGKIYTFLRQGSA